MGNECRVIISRVALVATSALLVALAWQNRQLGETLSRERAESRHPRSAGYVPAFREATLAGDSVTIGEAPPGERQVLVVFNTTCRFCLASIPAWKELTRVLDTLSSPRTWIYGIALDSAADAVRRYGEAHGLPYPVLRFPSRKWEAMYKTRSVPVTMVLGDDGRIIYARLGVVDSPVIADSIRSAVRWRADSIAVARR